MKDSPTLDLRAAHDGFGPARAYLECLRRDGPFYWFILIYAVVGWLMAHLAGVPQKFTPLLYSGLVLSALGGVVALIPLVVAGALVCGVSPQAIGSKVGRIFTPRIVASLALFVAMATFGALFAIVKGMMIDVVPFFADPFLLRLDEMLHGQDPWFYTRAVMPVILLPALETLYFAGWSIALSVTLLAAVLMTRLEAVRNQYVWSFMITWVLLGNVVAMASMSAGPLFYDMVTTDGHFGEMLSHLIQYAQYHELARDIAWQAHMGKLPGSGIAISAFPSLHVAQATLIVLVARRVHRWAYWAAFAFLALILFGSVHLGWHYAVDGYFAIAATVLIWKVVGYISRVRIR